MTSFKRFLWLIAVLGMASVLFIGCSNGSGQYLQTVESLSHEIPVIREFKEIFPDASVVSEDYQKGDKNLTLLCIAYPFSRYQLTLEVKVDLNGAGKIEACRKPKFIVREITQVIVSRGKVEPSYKANASVDFEESEWKKIYESKGDLSIIIQNLIKDQPIKDVESLK
jgi:hypothetical protein